MCPGLSVPLEVANMGKKWMKSVALVWLMLTLFTSTVCAAQAMTPTLVVEDQGNGYVYAVGTAGTFSINIQPEEVASAVFLSVDDTLYPVLLQDGVEISCDDVLFNQGSYQLLLYSNENKEGDYGYFPFTIENDYGGILGGNLSAITLNYNPDLVTTYAQDTGRFTYTLPDGQSITATVARDGNATASATLTLSENMRLVSIYRDGSYIADTALSFAVSGSYLLVMRSNEFGTNGNECYEVMFPFTIGETVVQSAIFQAPYAMEVLAVTIDGVPSILFSDDYVFLQKDGTYEVEFALTGTDVTFSHSFLRDTTPPAMSFDPPIDQGVVSTELSFQLSEPTAQVELRRNGSSVFASRNTIVADGTYAATVQDVYGNARTYAFEIEVANDHWQGYLPIIAGIALAVGVLVLRRYLVKPQVR